ncbi:hypothetical protein VPNG_02718 [Cytospora leucostoma]|uniref:C2H2-type domain-containing protein n=1 Tax=Cytospora leucostoma TaxID=1230097 RepID=A0A423XJZ4_9PEZI|nr:hypothetical protein VPNG_02718 [Cytospora leucostoma]
MGRGAYDVTGYGRTAGGYKQRSPSPGSSYDSKRNQEQASVKLEVKSCTKPEIDTEKVDKVDKPSVTEHTNRPPRSLHPRDEMAAIVLTYQALQSVKGLLQVLALTDRSPPSPMSILLNLEKSFYHLKSLMDLWLDISGPVAEEVTEEDDDPEATETESPWPSIYSADTPIMDENHHLTPFKKDFLEVVLLAFAQFRQTSPGKTNERTDGQPSSPVDSSQRGQGKNTSSNSGKRPLSSSGSNTGSGGTTTSGRSSKRRSVDRRFTFACPFAKKDPLRYRGCYHMILTRIRDVKQHITRCHYLPVYCPRCMESFDDESTRDMHIRSISCEERPFVQFEGCSKSQREQLSNRVSQKLPPEKQWFTVFDILFPGHPHPSTPLVDREIFEPMSAFRDFMTDQGPTLMLDFFKTKGVALNCQPQEERDLLSLQQTIIREGLEVILDTVMPSLGREISHNDATGSADLQLPEPDKPVQDMPPPAKEAKEGETKQDVVLETVAEPEHVTGGQWRRDTRAPQIEGTGSFFNTTSTQGSLLEEQSRYVDDRLDTGNDVAMSNFTHSGSNMEFEFVAPSEWSSLFDGFEAGFQRGT